MALARALVLEPEITLLGRADQQPRRARAPALPRRHAPVVKQLGVTVVIITHEHNEALGPGSAGGRDPGWAHWCRSGTPQEVFTQALRTLRRRLHGRSRPSGTGRWSDCAEGLCTGRTEAGVEVDDRRRSGPWERKSPWSCGPKMSP